MAFAKRFEEIEIWQHARALAALVYQAFAYGTLGYQDPFFRNQITAAASCCLSRRPTRTLAIRTALRDMTELPFEFEQGGSQVIFHHA